MMADLVLMVNRAKKEKKDYLVIREIQVFPVKMQSAMARFYFLILLFKLNNFGIRMVFSLKLKFV
jgi:hypothetical protein